MKFFLLFLSRLFRFTSQERELLICETHFILLSTSSSPYFPADRPTRSLFLRILTSPLTGKDFYE